MPAETYDAEELDEIKVGDRLISSGMVAQEVYEVVDTGVIGEMNVVGQDEDEVTAGVTVQRRGAPHTRDISYKTLIETDIYRVSRDWNDLTDEQAAELREW